jgi:hypothetical protein
MENFTLITPIVSVLPGAVFVWQFAWENDVFYNIALLIVSCMMVRVRLYVIKQRNGRRPTGVMKSGKGNIIVARTKQRKLNVQGRVWNLALVELMLSEVAFDLNANCFFLLLVLFRQFVNCVELTQHRVENIEWLNLLYACHWVNTEPFTDNLQNFLIFADYLFIYSFNSEKYI